MNNLHLLDKIMDVVEYYVGDCSCDEFTKCKHCFILADLHDLLEKE
jgi:hypothetical protein